MTSFVSKEELLFMGIDGGGTKCRCVISNVHGKILGKGLGGPANPFFGVPRAIESIEEAAHDAINDAGLEKDDLKSIVAGVGLAGVNLPGLFEQLNSWHHPFADMYLTTDMDIANRGAHGGAEGAVIIVGTGSCGYINTSDEQNVFGGHGFPIGDKASGAWMGLKAIEYTLMILDGFEEPNILAEKVCEHYSVKSGFELSEKLIGQSSQQYAEIASLIFACAEQGNILARKIVDEGAHYIGLLANKLLSGSSTKLCLIGGLAEYYLPVLNDDIAKKISPTLEQPEIGAVYFAIQNHSNKSIKSA